MVGGVFLKISLWYLFGQGPAVILQAARSPEGVGSVLRPGGELESRGGVGVGRSFWVQGSVGLEAESRGGPRVQRAGWVDQVPLWDWGPGVVRKSRARSLGWD